MLKRPSDSNSAPFSVMPRDRLVYASGTVRSTASNNAPYKDGVRQREKRRGERERERERERGRETETLSTYTFGHTSYTESSHASKV